MPYIDEEFKPKPFSDLAYNNSGKNLLVYYPWRGGVKQDGPTPTPVISPTPQPSPSPTPSPSITPTPSSTITPTPTITPTATITPTPTPSATPSPAFDSDAQAYIDALITAGETGITPTISAATDTLFTTLKTGGVYSKLMALYPFFGTTAATQKFNMVDPRDADDAYRLTFGGGVTHTTDGLKGDGVNGFARTYIKPYTAFTINNIHASFEKYVSIAGSDPHDYGAKNTINSLRWRSETERTGTAEFFQYYFNDGTKNYIETTNSTPRAGYFYNGYSGTTGVLNYNNGGELITITGMTNETSAFNLASNDITLLSRNGTSNNPDGGTYSKAGYSHFSFGEALSSSEQTTLYNAINAFNTSIGR